MYVGFYGLKFGIRILNIAFGSVFNALSIGSGPEVAVLLCENGGVFLFNTLTKAFVHKNTSMHVRLMKGGDTFNIPIKHDL